MRALSTALFAAALPLAACASTAAAAPEDVAAVRSPPAECEAFAADRVQLTAIPNVARQGETLGLWAYVRQGPYAPKEVPLACLDRWTVNPAGAAVVSPDGTRLTIAADAPAGEILTVTARAAGNFTYLTTAIVGRDDIVLTGRWRQTAVDCPAGASPRDAVQELEFDSLGGYSVTYLPFETYKDYWGGARFDAAGSRLTLTVDQGNRRPVGAVLEGGARIDGDGRLILDGFHLGPQNPQGPSNRCRYVFSR